jgi:RhoGEF domain
MPVQRLPRYVMLLNELMKNTAQKHPDYQNINKAVVQLKEVAGLIFFCSHAPQPITQRGEEQRNTEKTSQNFVSPSLFLFPLPSSLPLPSRLRQ